jgi:hypothetical protein
MSVTADRSELVSQLKHAQDWGDQQAQHWEQKQVELKRTIQQTNQEIERLQKRLIELNAQQSDLENQAGRREDEVANRMRKAIEDGMVAGAQILETRELLLQKQRKIRAERVANVLKEPKFQEKIAEFRQFQETQAQLAHLPASYRNAILQHHQTVQRELEPIFMAADQPLPKTDKPAKCIGIVASIEPDFIQPEAMAILIPVPFDIYSAPSAGEDSLKQTFAYRCVGAVTSALRKIGLSEVSVNYGDHKGYLSLQVWLNGKKLNGDIRQSISMEFQQMRDYASEMQAVRLGIEVTWLPPELLDDGENEDSGEEV